MRAVSRIQAFGIHLLLSATLISAYLAVVYLFWYTGPLFWLQDAWEVNRVAIFVDVVVGPLLTLILFKQGKPGLKFDMSLVILIQLSALAVGVWYTYLGHPQFIAFNNNRMVVVNYADINQSDIPDWIVQPWRGPELVYAEPAQNDAERAKLVSIFMQTARDIDRVPSRYRPIADHWERVEQHDLHHDPDARSNPQFIAAAEAFAAEQGRPQEELLFLPVEGRLRMATLVLDRHSHEILGAIDANFF